jgi:hypothetical protein
LRQYILYEILPLLFFSAILYSQTHSQNKPDSIVYIKQGDLTTITTQADIEKRNQQNSKYPNPYSPSSPISLTIDKATQIELSIYDSTSSAAKYYIFDAKTTGDYQINLWAFYEDLSPGAYVCIIKYPGKMIKQNFTKLQ